MNSAQQRAVQRRRHTVAGTLLTMLLVVAWLWAAGVLDGPGGLTDSSAPGRVSPTAGLIPVVATSYMVQPGDTLWSVARGLQPTGDVRPLVDQLARHTGGGPLRAGQRIRLP